MSSFCLDIHAQTICNNKAFVSIHPGIVLSAGTILNNSQGTIINNGALKVATVNNSGVIEGKGVYSLSQNIYNSGTFVPDTSTFIYDGAGTQYICALNYYNLNIAQNGIRNLTLSDSGTITVKGVFSPDLTQTSYIRSESKIKFSASVAQNIPAFNFYNLEVDNLSGVTLTGQATIDNSLKVTNGFLGSYGNLTLLSDVNRTAEIDGAGNGDVLGSVNIQRYIPSGFGYKLISAPFQEATVNELSQEIDLSANFTSLYRYNENLVSSGWLNYTNPTGVLNPMEGYSANLGNSSSPKTIELSGVVNNGVMSTTWYNHNHAYTKGFNLVGNPYPSSIDWNISGGWNRTNIDNAIYYFNASATDQYGGTYSTYINGVSSDGIANNIIGSMQGFFIHVSDGAYPVSATMQINNNARVNNSQAVFHRQVQGSSKELIRLQVSNDFNSDPTVIYFDEQAGTKFEENLDALKIKNTDPLSPSLYSLSSDGLQLSINAVPLLTDTFFEVKIGLNIKETGVFKFNALSIQNIPTGWYTYLKDIETGKYQDLSVNPSYQVFLEKGEYENRFRIVFSQNSIADQSEVNVFSLFVDRNVLNFILNQERSDQGEVMISDMQGKVIVRKHISGMGKHELQLNLSSGIYIVNYKWAKGKESQKIFIQNQQ